MTAKTVNILGYNVHTLNCRSCVEDIVGWLKGAYELNCVQRSRWLACLNPHSYAVALDDKSFSDALHEADWVIPDGVGILLASMVLGGTVSERVTGSDIFYGVHEELNRTQGFKVFFLGSTEQVLAEIESKMAVDYPNVIFAGSYSPPFKPEFTEKELEEMADIVNSVAVDVLWVGMTAPKQEKWIAEMIDRLDVRFVAAVGAVFDFYVGRVKRSNPIFQRLGLEWLPRLLQQPRRLWRRMFVSAPIFIWHVIKARLGYHPRNQS